MMNRGPKHRIHWNVPRAFSLVFPTEAHSKVFVGQKQKLDLRLSAWRKNSSILTFHPAPLHSQPPLYRLKLLPCSVPKYAKSSYQTGPNRWGCCLSIAAVKLKIASWSN